MSIILAIIFTTYGLISGDIEACKVGGLFAIASAITSNKLSFINLFKN
jgi:hypothetical protein